MNNIQKIMFGELRPWLESNNLPNEYYKPLTRGLNTIQATHNPHYELNFIRHFSDKTQYYKKLIDNDLVSYCNILFAETESVSDNLIAYKVDKSKKILHAKIKGIANIISTQKLDLLLIKSPNADFSIDRQFKESTYIIFHLLSALIKCCLEIQYHFCDRIVEDDIWEIPDFYTQLLQQQSPENTFIKEILIIPIEPTSTDIQPETPESNFATQLAQDNYTRFMQEVQPYQFVELQKYKDLSTENQTRLIRLIVGKGVPYAVAMLHFLEYPKRLKEVYSMNKEKQYNHIAKCLGAVVRSVKGNFLVLNPKSNEDRFKYTAAENEQIVKNDYLLLKDKTL